MLGAVMRTRNEVRAAQTGNAWLCKIQVNRRLSGPCPQGDSHCRRRKSRRLRRIRSGHPAGHRRL